VTEPTPPAPPPSQPAAAESLPPSEPAAPARPPAPPAAPPVHPWLAVAALAQTLSESGELVTQLHCTAEHCPSSWDHSGNGAHVFAGAETDMVVTTDGTEHLVSEAQQ